MSAAHSAGADAALANLVAGAKAPLVEAGPGMAGVPAGIRNLVFDFGAVLVAWQPVRLMEECFPDRSHDPAQAGHLAHQIFGHPDWQDYDRGAVSMDTVVQRTSARLGLNAERFGALVRSIGERLVPMAPSIAWLDTLRQARDAGAPLRLYFLSNMPTDYARVLEQQHAFVGWFDGGIFSGDVGTIKPDPGIYQMLQQRHALVPQETVFFDDLLGNVQAAHACGWHGLQFHSVEQARQALAQVAAGISG
ncbi:MAG: HAD family hydrolase [Rhodoferax sp.]